VKRDFGNRFEHIKREASREDLYRFLYAMPNGGDLHHHHGGSSFPDVIHRLASDARVTGVTARFLDVVLRFLPHAPGLIAPSFKFIYEHRDLWRGINMAGREDNEKGHPRRFTDAYDAALRRFPNVGIAIHAGEENEPSRHIFDTLRLGATRIGHGVNLIDDARVMQLMRCGKFLLEINMVSNHLLGYVDEPADHPFPIYLRQGIPCCLSTDDRGMWDSNMTDEYFLAVTQFNLSWEEIRMMGRNSLEFAFAETGVKSALVEKFERRLVGFESEYSGAMWRRKLTSVNAVTHGYGRRFLKLAL
jgi:adenosine deaminase CECR1